MSTPGHKPFQNVYLIKMNTTTWWEVDTRVRHFLGYSVHEWVFEIHTHAHLAGNCKTNTVLIWFINFWAHSLFTYSTHSYIVGPQHVNTRGVPAIMLSLHQLCVHWPGVRSTEVLWVSTESLDLQHMQLNHIHVMVLLTIVWCVCVCLWRCVQSSNRDTILNSNWHCSLWNIIKCDCWAII